MTEPATFEVDRVSGSVQSCLQALLDAADALGVDLPSRQIATASGSVPQDCEQVVATAIQLGTGAPEATRGGAGTYPASGANVTMYTLTVQLSITRKTNDTPTGSLGTNAPDAAAYLLNLTSGSADAAVILSAVNALLAGDLYAQTFGQAIPRTVTFATPQGGMVSTTCRITMSV